MNVMKMLHSRRSPMAHQPLIESFDLQEESLRVKRRALGLYRTYAALKCLLEGKPQRKLSHKDGPYLAFRRCVENLEDYEQQTGTQIHDTVFCLAMFDQWQKSCWPNMFSSESAIPIYRRYRLKYMVRKVGEVEVDTRMVDNIAQAWNISREEVVSLFGSIWGS